MMDIFDNDFSFCYVSDGNLWIQSGSAHTSRCHSHPFDGQQQQLSWYIFFQNLFQNLIFDYIFLLHFVHTHTALMDDRERYFLNGNWIVDWPGRYETSGVAFHYERVKDSEVVHSRGPLQQDLIVMV